MQHYRVYMIDGDGHIKRAVDLECENDDEAKIKARQLAEGGVIELWQGGRQIAVIGEQSE